MNQLAAALRRVLMQPAFLTVVIVLLLAAVGLNATVQLMRLNFRKQAVDLSRSLTEIPARLGPWVQVSIDETVSHDMEEMLGTQKYIFRDYLDSRLVSQRELDEFTEKGATERRHMISAIQMRRPEAVVNAAVTYYTGMVDTVAHIPDRCYIADGFEPSSYDLEQWSCLAGRPGDERLRYIVFEDTTPGRAAVAKNVAYFFHCNGRYVNDPIGVRRRLQNLFEKHGYYAKIEVQTLRLPKDESARVMDDFLRHLLPEVEKCLPDWDKVTAGQ